MGDKFIYTQDKALIDRLINSGYRLINKDTRTNICVFENANKLTFDSDSYKFVLSNTMMF